MKRGDNIDITVKSNAIFLPIHRSRKRYIVLKGSAGSGKSQDTAQQYIIRLMRDAGRNLLCIRKSNTSNRDSTFSQLVGAIRRMGVDGAWSQSLSPLTLSCKNGNRVIFRGVNSDREREKLKSITFENGKLTDVWIEEATEISREDFEIIDDRLRGNLSKGLFYQIKLTFNPVSASHWIKKTFFDVCDPDVVTHHSTYLDNAFCDAAFLQRMERRKKLDPDGFRIYGLGEWGETGGLILKNWKVFEVNQDVNHYDNVMIGQDFGFNHANAILTVATKDGDIFILQELYVSELDTAQIIEKADEVVPKNFVMYCDSAEPDRIVTWRRSGYNARAVAKEAGSIMSQIDWLKQRMIFIHPSCTNTISEISQWRWEQDARTGEYTDKPAPSPDDAMAALRYAIEGMRKPRAVRLYNKSSWRM